MKVVNHFSGISSRNVCGHEQKEKEVQQKKDAEINKPKEFTDDLRPTDFQQKS